jgi:hypothetical protein
MLCRPALFFTPGLVLFLLQASMDRGLGGPGWSSGFGRFGNYTQHVTEFFQAIGRIPPGVASALAGYQQVAVRSEFIAVLGQKPGVDSVWQTIAGSHGPAQNSLGAEFVDVLPPGPAAAGVGKSKLPHGNLQPGANNQHQCGFHFAARIDFL